MKTTRSLEEGLDRLFKNFYPWWKTTKELSRSDSPEALLEEWRRSPKGSQEGRKAMFFREAVGILAMSLGLPREEAEALVWEHISERR
jgi:hypothetical protein